MAQPTETETTKRVSFGAATKFAREVEESILCASDSSPHLMEAYHRNIKLAVIDELKITNLPYSVENIDPKLIHEMLTTDEYINVSLRLHAAANTVLQNDSLQKKFSISAEDLSGLAKAKLTTKFWLPKNEQREGNIDLKFEREVVEENIKYHSVCSTSYGYLKNRFNREPSIIPTNFTRSYIDTHLFYLSGG